MNRRINTRVVDTGGVASPAPPLPPLIVIEKDASEIWWLVANTNGQGAQGDIRIFDGYDEGGKLVFHGEPYYSRPYNFIPPIHCEQGIYVAWDATIASFTIAWRPKKWDRAKPMAKDVITHPEA